MTQATQTADKIECPECWNGLGPECPEHVAPQVDPVPLTPCEAALLRAVVAAQRLNDTAYEAGYRAGLEAALSEFVPGASLDMVKEALIEILNEQG